MRLGIAFPIVIFIIAVIFLAWFLLAVTRCREEHNEKDHDYYADHRHYYRRRRSARLVVNQR